MNGVPIVKTASGVDSGRAWSVAGAGAVISGVAFGTVYTFGAFFAAMLDDFEAGRGATALVFGVTLLLFFGSGVVSGPLADRYGPRPLMLTGVVLFCSGLAATSQVNAVALGYLTYGVGVGLGGGLLVTPVYASVAGWFVQRRAIALGVLAAGNGIGTLILVPSSERLIDAFGWRDAYVVLSLVALALLLPSALVIARPPVPPAPRAVSAMRAVASTVAFRRLFLTSLFFFVSLFIALGFVVDFAIADGVSSARAALLVGIIGASSVVGRLGLTVLSGRVNSLRLLQGCLAAQPVAYVLWLSAGGNYAVLVAFALCLGVAYGGYVALGPEVAAALFGVVGLGGIMGLLFLGSAFGGFLGPPLAGWLADSSEGSVVPITFALVMASLSFLFALRIPNSPAQVRPAI